MPCHAHVHVPGPAPCVCLPTAPTISHTHAPPLHHPYMRVCREQATSSLTMKVLGTVRNIFTIFAGAAMYHEKVRPGSASLPRLVPLSPLFAHTCTNCPLRVSLRARRRLLTSPHLTSPTCVRQVSLNEWLGYSVALAGFAAYNAAKSGYFDGTPGAGGGGSGGSGGGGGGSGGAVLGLGQGGGVGTITPTSSYNALKVRGPSLFCVLLLLHRCLATAVQSLTTWFWCFPCPCRCVCRSTRAAWTRRRTRSGAGPCSCLPRKAPSPRPRPPAETPPPGAW